MNAHLPAAPSRYQPVTYVLDVLDETEAAAVLGCSKGHLQRLRYRGEGPAFFRVGRGVRYPRSAVAAWAANRLCDHAKE